MSQDGGERILFDLSDVGPYEPGIGDYDCNRIVELMDFAARGACVTGPNSAPYDVSCEGFDVDTHTIRDTEPKGPASGLIHNWCNL